MAQKPTSTATGTDSEYQTIDKTVAILELLASRKEIGVTLIAEELGYNKSIAYKILKKLQSLGYVSQHKARGPYSLGSRCLFLSDAFQSNSDVIQLSREYLVELAEKGQGGAHFGAPVGGKFMVLVTQPSPAHIQIAMKAGSASSPYASAMGKVLLAQIPPSDRKYYLPDTLEQHTRKTITSLEDLDAQLKKILADGYATEIEEELRGVGCVAVPVFDGTGKCVGAFSLSGPLSGTDFKINSATINLLKKHAKAMSGQLGHS